MKSLDSKTFTILVERLSRIGYSFMCVSVDTGYCLQVTFEIIYPSDLIKLQELVAEFPSSVTYCVVPSKGYVRFCIYND